MSKKRSYGLPEEVLGFLSTLFFVPALAGVALADWLFSGVSALEKMEVGRLFFIGWGANICGALLLFFARLPLYRRRRFLAFGTRELDPFHRRLYYLAYLLILIGMAFWTMIWFRLQ